MADLVLFHHILGYTSGVAQMADELRAAGHTVYAPDLFDGQLPATIEEGQQLVQQAGDQHFQQLMAQYLADLPEQLAYVGTSWGAALAQHSAQTRAGALGAVLLEAFIGLDAPWGFGPWPHGVPVQIHGMDNDPFFAGDGDLQAAREFVGTASGQEHAQLFTYAGSSHLFTDSSLPSHDPAACSKVMERVIKFLSVL